MAIATRPKPKVQHKKIHAKHHRKSKHYLKHYWPYLPMIAIIGIGWVINSAWSGGTVLGTQSNFSSQALLAETNDRRAEAGRPDLKLNIELSAAAQAKAEDMVKADYWAHTSPDGQNDALSLIAAAGYPYQSAGENLAYGFPSASDAITGWMGSPGHRANLLNAQYREVGFGVASSRDYLGRGPQTVIVAEYGQPLAAGSSGSSEIPAVVLGQNSQPVSRVQILTGNQAWSLAAVSALAGAALAIFITRHSLRLHKVLVKGEAFIIHHPLFDIASVLVFTAGFVLSRTSGLIS